jgi:multidrug efflux system outer membrane protein
MDIWRRATILGLVISTTALVGGCMLGPDPARPANVAEQATGFVNVADQPADDADQPITAPADLRRWWADFADPVTEDLVSEALAENIDLRIAAARVLAARSTLGVAIGQRWPAVSAGMSRDRARTTFDFGGGRTSAITTNYDLGINVAWQVDVFGKLRRSQQAAWNDLLASEAARQAVVHTVVAQVVRTRVAIATARRQLATQQANTASWQSTFELINRRWEQGLTSSLEVRLARENLAASRATEPTFQRQLRLAEHQLDVLLGRQPGKGDPLPQTLDELPPLEPVPLGLPASLLDRRPDLRASEFQAAARTARIGAAIADLFPDLSINASAGYQSSELEDLIDPASRVYRLLLEASLKIFAGGALRANVDLNRALAEQAAAEYAKLVLDALKEVEDALVSEQTAQKTYEALLERVEEARAAERLATERYERGVATLITVLETERRRRLAELELINTQARLWNARIDLYLALGGDWGVEGQVDPPSAATKAWSMLGPESDAPITDDKQDEADRSANAGATTPAPSATRPDSFSVEPSPGDAADPPGPADSQE